MVKRARMISKLVANLLKLARHISPHFLCLASSMMLPSYDTTMALLVMIGASYLISIQADPIYRHNSACSNCLKMHRHYFCPSDNAIWPSDNVGQGTNQIKGHTLVKTARAMDWLL